MILSSWLNKAQEIIEYFRTSNNHDALDAYLQIRKELGMGPFDGDALERVASLVEAYEYYRLHFYYNI